MLNVAWRDHLTRIDRLCCCRKLLLVAVDVLLVLPERRLDLGTLRWAEKIVLGQTSDMHVTTVNVRTAVLVVSMANVLHWSIELIIDVVVQVEVDWCQQVRLGLDLCCIPIQVAPLSAVYLHLTK